MQKICRPLPSISRQNGPLIGLPRFKCFKLNSEPVINRQLLLLLGVEDELVEALLRARRLNRSVACLRSTIPELRLFQ